jgi:hypothetical protein
VAAVTDNWNWVVEPSPYADQLIFSDVIRLGGVAVRVGGDIEKSCLGSVDVEKVLDLIGIFQGVTQCPASAAAAI